MGKNVTFYQGIIRKIQKIILPNKNKKQQVKVILNKTITYMIK